MKTKRWLFVVAALALAAAACGDDTGAGAAAETENDLGGREIRVAIENAYLPFNYIDPASGEGAGWDYDALAAICEQINCEPVFVETGWDGMIIAVSQGEFDMAADGITITEERAEQVDFSQGYISVEQRLMVRLDEDRFSSLDEFQAGDYVVGTQTGTTNFATAVEEYGEDRVIAFEQFGFAVQALIGGDVDAVIIDDTAGLGYVGENADQIRLLDGSLASDELGFIFPKGSDLVDPVNYALDQMEADGTLEALAARYFTDQFQITYEDIFPEEDEEG